MPDHTTPASIADELREIDAELARADLTPIMRQALEAMRASTVTRGAAFTPVQALSTQTVSGDARINGVVVGINLGTIIFNRDPVEDERRRLVWYLGSLAGRLHQLPLRGISAKIDDSTALSMPQVYVSLALQSHRELAEVDASGLKTYFDTDDGGQLATNWKNHLKRDYDPEWVRPDRAIINMHSSLDRVTWAAGGAFRGDAVTSLLRSMLAAEVVAFTSRLVILGDPGSGKSTFFRHLAWVLAQRGLDQASPETDITGWERETRLLPIMLPLRELAGTIANGTMSPVFAALRDEMLRHDVTKVDDLLSASLDNGAAIILLDGLDEVPIEGIPGLAADRPTTLAAIRDFAAMHAKARIVVTCRTRAFDDALQSKLGWPVETLAPFTLGQVRAFVPAMFGEIGRGMQMSQGQAKAYEDQLVGTIARSAKLRDMAGTPLLLTMMAMVLYTKGTLPRDRPRLYEDVLELLLGQWDKIRNGQSLADVIGQPDWGSERIRPLINRLSFDAHLSATSDDGRGRITKQDLRIALIEFFENAGLKQPWDVANRCLSYFVDRSGLVVPDQNLDYVFAHLTLQEHCAGCDMVTGKDALARIMAHRGDDRWREPIMLGLGYILGNQPALIEQVLNRLIDRDEGGRSKPDERWYRDLIFAADIGADRDWGFLRNLNIAVDGANGIEARLRAGLVQLLADTRQSLPAAERVRAGSQLGVLGDPRIPVEIADWRVELDKRGTTFGRPAGYWCYVKPGTYRIGGWSKGGPSADISLPGFWIARFPVTVAQFAPFVEEGYDDGAEEWWTRNGWQWKVARRRTKPWRWDDDGYNGPNQAVIGVTWYEATAWCNWLTAQLREQLPAGWVVRLPTEAEWEAAAAYDDNGDRREYPWGPDGPTPELANFNEPQVGRPTPVGIYSAGQAACGALDVAGNVWECMTSHFESYPRASHDIVPDFKFDDYVVPWRGGSWWQNADGIRCGARDGRRPDDGYGSFGVRVVLAPPLASS